MEDDNIIINIIVGIVFVGLVCLVGYGIYKGFVRGHNEREKNKIEELNQLKECFEKTNNDLDYCYKIIDD